jgi:prepilin-type processing-associated H-X9-DG protein
MATLFTCPHCGRRTEIPDEFIGQTGPCVACGQAITIPAGSKSTRGRPIVTRSNIGLVITFCVAALALLGVIVVATTRIVRPALSQIRQSAVVSDCEENLQRITMALLAYEAANGHFPPAYTVDSAGQPMHSWRVMILPYMGPEEQQLYQMYNLAEPWDGPQNLQLVNQMPDVFRCADDTESMPGETSYLAVVGQGMVFTGKDSTKLADIQDGAGQTMMVVESAGSGIAWTQPRDVDAVMLTYGINSDRRGSLRAGHRHLANVAMVDGSVHRLPLEVSSNELRAMATIQGGEDMSSRLSNPPNR